MTSDQYAEWLAVARRHTRVANEAEDLLHEALIAAAKAGRLDLTEAANRRWLNGVLRRQAAFLARTAVRRRQREEVSVASDELVTAPEALVGTWGSLGLETLPRSIRSVLALALHGLRRDEICAVLGISSTAFRQRLVALRKRLGPLPEDLQREALALAYARRQARADDLALGLIRRALFASSRVAPGLGTHDPDGHLFVLGRHS
ncbi:MAG: transcriptional regulator [Bacteroidota bacterium]